MDRLIGFYRFCGSSSDLVTSEGKELISVTLDSSELHEIKIAKRIRIINCGSKTLNFIIRSVREFILKPICLGYMNKLQDVSKLFVGKKMYDISDYKYYFFKIKLADN